MLRGCYLLPGVLALLIALPAAGGSCEADCEGEDCTGGCSIDSLSCDTACIDDGCPGTAICSIIGGGQCQHQVSSTCRSGSADELPPQPFEPEPLRVAGEPEWAVLRFESDPRQSVDVEDVTAVASSSATFASRSVAGLVERSRRSLAEQSRKKPWPSAITPRFERPPQERFHFALSHHGRCAPVKMVLGPRRFPEPLPEQAVLLVRATSDRSGRIAGAHVLFSTIEDEREPVIDFLKMHARILPMDHVAAPLEAFIVLFVEPGDNFGWFISGARPLL